MSSFVRRVAGPHFIHPLVDGHLGCSRLLAPVNHTEHGVQTPDGVPAVQSLGYKPGSGIAGPAGPSVFHIPRNRQS